MRAATTIRPGSSCCWPSTRAAARTPRLARVRGRSSIRRPRRARRSSSPRRGSLAQRLRELVDAGEARAGGIVVLLRAFTHVDAYEEALERAGLRPYVVGGRGYWSQQQVEDLLRLLEAVANPLDDEMLLGALACPANASAPTRSGCCGARARVEAEDGERPSIPHLWPLVAWRFGGSERRPDPVDETWLERIPADDASRLERFCAIARRAASRRPGARPRRPRRAHDDRLRLRPRICSPAPARTRADGQRPQADAARARVRAARRPRPARLPRLGAGAHRARRARGHRRDPGRGSRRGPDHDRARGQGPRVPGRRRAGPRPRRSPAASAVAMS